ncbi:hypothetical protein [Actinokineospora sp. NBRC 105648]|uniref:hypothetical protein n=1 Tax=Actinokineospora sp. NBRC 105648 TaxID=3032206 RepID=UPI0024A5EB02|nr:hypothetical protein [Actinokineospora sp. NBRC 105648]GLZ42828.1 hypothetical protein Acsp05_64520 [Actinokineospora sp. NBRC 105648]
MTVTGRELDVLLVDYQALRDDERATTNSQAALASVFVALLAGLFAILVGDCRFRGASAAAARAQGSCYELAEPVYVVAPALPVAVLAYIVMLGTQITIKSFYMRAVENELRAYVPKPMAAIPAVTAASGTELLLAITSPRRGSRAYLVMLVYLVTTFIVALAGWLVFVSFKLGLGARLGMLLFYGPVLLLLIRQGFTVNTGGRALLRVAASKLADGGYPAMAALVPVPTRKVPGERSMWSYLLLPRPQDLIKWLFIPVAYVVGSLLVGPSATPAHLTALVGWLTFEYLLYQARYQWNDIRGLTDDINHPARQERGRLPTGRGTKFAVSTSILVIAVRMALAVTVALVVTPLTWPLLVAIGGVWVFAVAYEALRTQGSESMGRAVAIWLIVGAGYTLRTSFGLVLAGLVLDWHLAAFAVAAWSFGVMFVTLTWAIEATGHCFGGPDPLFYPPALRAKPHLFHLLRFTGSRITEVTSPPPPEALTIKPVSGRTSLTAPWNIGVLRACLIW